MTHPTKAPPQRSAAAKPLSLLRAVGLAYSAPEPIVTPKVLLRLPDMGDFEAWAALREQSRRFLAPWEPAWPLDDLTRPAFRRRIEAACLPHNAVSVGLLERVGFTREGLARQYLCINGTWMDHVLYAFVQGDPIG